MAGRSDRFRKTWSRARISAVAPLFASALIAVAGALGSPAPAAADPGAVTGCPAPPYAYSETRFNYGTAANTEPLDVDEFLPAAANGNQPPSSVPGVILVHGGGWVMGNFSGHEGTSYSSGDSLASLAECFAENGVDAFSIDYALTDTYHGTSEQSFPQNLADISTAISWAKLNAANLNGSEIFILGTSAGGNLAALAGENAMGFSDGLAGVISQSGPADLTALGANCTSASPCPNGSAGQTVHAYLGCYETSSSCTLENADGSTSTVTGATAYGEASPVTSPTGTVPYLIASSSDEIIPLAQATDLDQVLNAQCSAAGGHTSDELAVLPGDQHADTYTDLMPGPELDFMNAVTGGTLPGNCATASPLTGAAMAYDAASSARTLIRFGGCCTSQGRLPAVTDWFDTSSGTWKSVSVTGSSPSPRLGAVFGYDPVSGKLILFGGEKLPGGSAEPVLLNDTWEFSYTASTNAGTWTQVPASTACPSGCPAARYAAAADQAPRNEGVVLYGGENIMLPSQSTAPTAFFDTWLWNGTSWAPLAPAGSPMMGRYGAMLAYDGLHNADVLYGGDQPTSACDSSCLNLLDDTWSLTVNTTTGAWTWTENQLTSTGTPREFPAGASGATGALLSGGLNGSSSTSTGSLINTENLLADTWTWNGSAWTQACTTCTVIPPAGFGAAMADHRSLAEDVLYGGYTSTGPITAPATTWIWNGTAWDSG